MTKITKPFITIGFDADDRVLCNIDSTLLIGSDVEWFTECLAGAARGYADVIFRGGRFVSSGRKPNEGDREQIEAQIVETFARVIATRGKLEGTS